MLGPSMSEDSSRASSEVQTRQRTLPGAAANCCGAASGRSRSNTRTSFSCPAKGTVDISVMVRFNRYHLSRVLRGTATSIVARPEKHQADWGSTLA